MAQSLIVIDVGQIWSPIHSEGAFTLLDTETDIETKTHTDTDRLTQINTGICVDVCCCVV